MTRKLHEKDVCRRSTESLQEELTSQLDGDVVVLAAEDERLQPLLPIDGQQSLFATDDQLDFGENATICTEPIAGSHSDPETHFPSANDERFHYDSNTFDTTLLLFHKCGYFQRGPPFMDATRITKRGGTILTLTGIQPEKSPDHNAKWWVPNSDDVTLDEIVILRYQEYKTPIVLSVFTATAETTRHTDAEIVTKPN
jgi:hypothetical protein